MRKYIAMAAVAMTLASCTNDDTPEVPAVDKLTDTPIMVNAGVGDLVTRAGMTTDDLVDLGLHITNEANDKYSFANIEFEKNTDGEFVLAGSTIPLWQNETQKIIVQAYSPYNAAWTDIHAVYDDFEVKTDQSTEANLKASDLLWAEAEVDPAATTQTGDIKYNAGALDITLNHICSKIIVNVRFGNEFSDMIIAEDGLSIEGLNPYGEIILANGSIGYSGYTTAEITAYKNQTATAGYDATFEAILIPQNALFSVKIALDGRTFQWENDDSFTFKPGIAYTLNLNVGKDEITLAGVTVGGWNEGETLVGGEAEEVLTYKTDLDNAKVGDLITESGKLIDKDDLDKLTDAAKAQVVGVVFWTPSDTVAADRNTPASLTDDKIMAKDYPECTHGLAVAVKALAYDDSPTMYWQPRGSCEYVKSWQAGQEDYKPTAEGFVSISSGTGATDNINRIYGYQNTVVLRAYNEYCTDNDNADSVVRPVAALDAFACPAPAESTGWFLPSVKELHMLCYKDVDNVNGVYGTDKTDTREIVNTSLSAVGGDALESNNTPYYWSSSENEDRSDLAFSVNFSIGRVRNYYLKYSTYMARAVCAF